MQELPLAAYADEPIYNMKAVSQRTGIPAATLRAWERRYRALAPHRSNGNYRLYSERDIAVLGWLQAQLNAGLSISRAVALLERLRASSLGGATLPPPTTASEPASKATARATAQATATFPQPAGAANWDQLATTLKDALVMMDERQAGEVMAEAFALYTVEDVCTNLIAPTLAGIGSDWFDQKVSVAQEHFASSYLMARLMALFNSARMGGGPLILVCCAPSERHEIGAMMLALLLRRAGHHVCYLGADLPLVDLVKAAQQWRPRVVAVSAMMSQALGRLEELADMLRTANVQTHLVYGGRAFSLPEAGSIHPQGDYVGADLQQGVQVIERLLLMELSEAGPYAH